MANRYDTTRSPEGQYQPGSNETVLINKLDIVDPMEMDDIELNLLDQLYEAVFSEIEEDQSIAVGDIFEWHRKWLGNVYVWAGKERSVNLGKGGFHFAAAQQIPHCLSVFENQFLSRYTPCHQMDDAQLVAAIAVIHVEFILIHPFREGNGRIARLLADVMTLQAGKPELDYSSWDVNREEYFRAIQSGLGRDYEPMKVLVRQALRDAESAARD